MRHLFSMIGLAVFLGACSSGAPSGDTALQAELRAAQKQWEQAGSDDYSYVGRWLCFCPPEYTDPVDVEVRAGEVTRVRYRDPGSLGAVPDPERYRSVEGMFAYIQDAIEAGAASIDASYDGAYGYPVDVFIDRDERIADEEYGFRLEMLEAAE